MSESETKLTDKSSAKSSSGLENGAISVAQDLPDTTQVSQQIEAKQAESVSEMQKNQEQKEQALQEQVYFPQDISFEQKRRNARGYILALARRDSLRKMQKHNIQKGFQTIMSFEALERPSSPKAEIARNYLRHQILLGRVR